MPATPPDIRHTIPPAARLWLDTAGVGLKATYRVDEVARLLNIAERTVYTWISAGRLAILDTTGTAPKKPTRIPITSLLRLHAHLDDIRD